MVLAYMNEATTVYILLCITLVHRVTGDSVAIGLVRVEECGVDL